MPTEALAEISKKLAGAGISSREFDFAGTKVTLRVLTVREELDVRRELNSVLGQNPMAIDYIYKLEALGRALQALGGVDLLEELSRVPDKIPDPAAEKIAFAKNLLLAMGADSLELLYSLYRVLSDQVKLRLLKPFKLEDLLTAEELEETAKLDSLKAAERRRLEASGMTRG